MNYFDGLKHYVFSAWLMVIAVCYGFDSHAFMYLDGSFGANHNGYELIEIGSSNSLVNAAIQPDGKIVMAGSKMQDEAYADFLTTRYSDGGLDTSFGDQGYVVDEIAEQSSAGNLALQPDGKIVVVGASYGQEGLNIALIRYLSNGSRDTAFGDGGLVLIPQMYGNTMALQADGKIVIGASDGDYAPSLVRYLSDGSGLDQTFGTSGIVTLPVMTYANVGEVIIQSDGKILMIGQGTVDVGHRSLIARYNADGTLDTAGFNSPTGYIIHTIPETLDTYGSMNTVALQGNGKIIIMTQSSTATVNDITHFTRYNTDGTLDESFGVDGYARLDPDNIYKGTALAIDADDNIVITGYKQDYNTNSLMVTRMLADGSGIDTTFGQNGWIVFPIGTNSYGADVLIQADGRIIITGSTDGHSIVARFFPHSDYEFIGITSPLNGATITDSSFAVHGYASEPNMNVVVKVDDVQTALLASDEHDYWDAGSYSLVNGLHTVTAELWNGTTQLATTTNTITMNATGDTITIASPVDGSTITTANPYISGGSSRAASSVRVYLDGNLVGTATTNASGIWTMGQSLLLGNGAREIYVELMDGETVVADATSIVTVNSTVPPIYWGNTIRVDSQFGSDLTCGKTTLSSPFDKPCLTVSKAFSIAQPGDQILVFPGVYNEAGLTLPTGTASAPVAVRGLDSKTTIIQKTGTTTDTDLVTMGEYSSLSDVTLKLASNEHHALRGIVFSGTTTETASIKNVDVYVDNSAASPAGASNVYGVHSVGTGRPDVTQQAIQSSKIEVASRGDGDKRALLIDAANTINSRESAFSVACPQGDCTGSFIGIETNAPSAIADIRRSDIQGYVGGATGYTGTSLGADVAQTAGTMNIDLCSLTNAHAAGLEFSGAHQSFMFWGIDGLLPDASPRYVRFGSGSTLDSIISLPMHKLTLVKSLRVQLVTPSSSSALTFVVLKNGEDTNLFVTVPANQTLGMSANTSVTFNAGDTIALKLTNQGSAGGASNAIISVETY